MSKHVPSFRSYYNSFAHNGHKKDKDSPTLPGDHVEVTEISPEVKILPQLLIGEEIIARAQGVHVFQPLSANNQGLIGELYVTNFKLSFQTITFPEYRREHYADVQDFWHPWCSGLIDIPLASISGLFRVSKNGRRKPFKIGPLKRIVVMTKNFRLETFSFLQSSTTDSHGVASALAGYVFPSEKERLFVFSRDGKNKDESPRKRNHVLFSVRSDWEKELARLGCHTDDWRLTQANEDFHLCQNLPKCFVVATSLGDDSQLETLCLHLNAADDRRPCVWCWSSPVNGAALCRMSGDLIDDKMVNAVQRSHPKKHAPRVLEVGLFCPTVKEVKKSFDMWRDSFLVESTSILEERDDKWFIEIEGSKWLLCISRCLDVARMATLEICQGMSVILKESGDRDLNCLISALTQLCLDPVYRTIAGFQRLIEKEFVALGHRFQERLALVRADPEKESPILLLFLDCVFQLTTQYPASFGFTDVYLLLLYDSALMGAFRTFSFNCQRETVGSRKGATSTNLTDFWQLDFTKKAHLTNRLYLTFSLLEKSSPNLAATLKSPILDILIPNPAVPWLAIWYHCYFRYIPPLATRGVFEPKMDSVLDRTCDAVEAMCREVGMAGSGGMPVILEDDGVSVDGAEVEEAGGGGERVMDLRVRRRSQLVRPFTPQNAAMSHSLMTFQK